MDIITIPISSSIKQVNPSLIFEDGFELENNSVIPSSDFSGSFTEGINNVEFYIYNAQKSIQYSNYNFSGYQISNNSLPQGSGPYGETQEQALTGSYTTNEITINPENDIYSAGYQNGTLYGVYNFINHQLSSSSDTKYYLAEISGDRTEIRIKSNYISNDVIQTSYVQFEQTITSTDFFDEFYITFGENEYHIGINSQLSLPTDSPEDDQASILIKLYDALPPNYEIRDELYVVTKTAETKVFEVEFENDLSVISDTISIKGPNTNLSIKDFVNNSTTYKNKKELLGTDSTGSKDEFLNVLNRKGITLTPNYSTASFGEFVNFSSAKQRTQNFYEKLSRIQTYENDINSINPITSSNNTSEVSSSIASLYTKIETEIKNFDGWDYYLYYNTSSASYPKDTSTGQVYPFPLLSTGSTTALTWLGSDVENDQYYGGALFSASRYDDNNQNWLYYTIPTFITEQSSNDNYVQFSNMVGQSFDELWLYTKTITAKLNTTNVLDEGVPLSLADDVITSLGYTGFGNNYNNQDNFIGMIGNDDGSYLPPTGSELILNYIAVNKGKIINYWDPEYAFEGYVEQLIDKGFPYPIDAVSKEIFKRLYHNMSSLVKRKGTVAGLRQLINIWGIPNTILRINEFGGKNKDQTDDYDLWYERYSYAFTPVANSYQASASAVIPWQPLYRNKIADGDDIVPDGVAFRFKTTGYPSSSFAGSFNSQSLAVKKSNGLNNDEFDWGIMLNYTGSTSGSYRGAGNSDYRDWAEMKFYISGAAADGGNVISDPIYLPFFDKGWWSVLLQRDTHTSYTDNQQLTTYTLYAKNKIYNGNDGNSLGFEGSSSIQAFGTSGGGVYGTGTYGNAVYGAFISSSINYAWNKFGVNPVDGVYIGGRIQGSKVGTTLVTNIPGQAFSGSFQEFRYYSNDISESVFNDFVMNPESIEGNSITGSESSFDIVNFRAPLGNELESFFTSSNQVTSSAYIEQISSSHPAVTASSDLLITASFYNPADGSLTSSYNITYEANPQRRTFSKTNVETYFLDQPAVGFRNRISNKIQNTQDLNFGNVLSGLVSIEKDPFISQSYTENLNQLEVAFSPQDEINDDIIQSLGFGAIQEVLADPRFRSSTSDFYPQLRRIADDYFKKYQGGNVYDYLRLIKFFDDSLFKAIKNYVPARTSVSTGIVIHQNMLERNRYREPRVDMVTTQSYAITNIPLTTKNLVLTGSIEMFEFTGSAGGSVNQYNVTGSQSGYYGLAANSGISVSAKSYTMVNSIPGSYLIPGFNPPEFIGEIYGEVSNVFNIGVGANDYPTIPYLRSKKPIKAYFSILAPAFNPSSNDELELIISSSLRGEIYSTGQYLNSDTVVKITPELDILPEETISFWLYNNNAFGNTVTDGITVIKTYDPQSPPSLFTSLAEVSDISSSANPSSQEYIEFNQTPVGLLGEPANQQYGFFDGEFSGSTFSTHLPYSSSYVNPYNPYLRVSKYSIANDRTANLPVSSFSGGIPQNFRLIKDRDMDSSITNSPTTSTAGLFTNVPVSILTGSGFGTILATVQVDSGTILSFKITNNLAVGLAINDTLQVASGAFTGLSSVINLTIQAADLGQFGLLAPTTATVNNSGNSFFAFFAGVPSNLLNNRKYILSFLISSYTGTVGSRIGLSNVDSTGNVNLFTQGASAANSNGPFTASFETAFIPNGSETLSARISISPGFKGTISQFNIAPNYAEDSRWNEIAADIYLNPLQQDQWQIQNTQSIIFANSDYNPLNNNVNLNRSSSTRILLSYNDEQYQPENFQQIVTYSLDNTSQSLFADVPDSNYTQLASINPRYNGSTLQSLTYNTFTPSGSVGKIRALKTSRYNKTSPRYSSSVADSFLNGTSQSQVTGKNSWTGDVSYGKTAVIDKFPKFIAHFKSSYEQYNYWDSYQYNIDSLIEIPSQSIANRQFTPTAQLVDGSNIYKKAVATTFEPGRKMAVSYDSLQTSKQDLSTLPIGNYDIGGGSIEFLTLNSNAQSRITNALSWSYNYKGKVTGSAQGPFETQLQTGSIFAESDSEGFEDTNVKGFILQGAANANIIFNQGVGGGAGFSRSTSAFGYLQVSGPQLALYHTYNTGIAREQFAPPLICYNDPETDTYKNPLKAFWVNQGQSPSNPDNYFQWAASASQCPAYQDNQEPFLIQRGDIIRAEGDRNIIIAGNSASIDFIEEFTVMSIENYHYSGSAELAQLLTGNVFNAPSAPPDGSGGGGILKNTSGARIDSLGLSGTSVGSQVQPLGTGGAEFTISTGLVNGNIEVIDCFISEGGNDEGDLANYSVGQTFTVNSSALGVFNFTVKIFVGNMRNITSEAGILISNTGSDNFFGVCDTNCTSGQQECHDVGLYTVKYPTFLVTDKDPRPVLMGLDKGRVQRFTIRRQIENDSSVMGYNIFPPSLVSNINKSATTGKLVANKTLSQSNQVESTVTNAAAGTYAILGSYTSGSGYGGLITIAVTGGGQITSVEIGITENSALYVVGETVTIPGSAFSGTGTLKFTLFPNNLEDNISIEFGGVSSITGEGFLIPNDLSEIQKSNALDIINQERSKNAFTARDKGNSGTNFSGINESS